MLLLLVMLSLTYSLRAQLVGPGGVRVADWYKADAAGTVISGAGAATDNSAVSQWNDAGGYGYNLTQTSAGNQPLFSNASKQANFNPTEIFFQDYLSYARTPAINIIDRVNGTPLCCWIHQPCYGKWLYGIRCK